MVKVLVPIAQGTEELEAVTIIDLMRRAEFEVIVASVTGTTEVTASRGVKLLADSLINECVDTDWNLVAVPGGMPGAENLRKSTVLTGILQRQAQSEGLLAAICAAPAITLGPLGLLEGRVATCYPGYQQELANYSAEVSDLPVVQDANLITSQGPGTASEFALTLIEALGGRQLRDKVAQAALFH